ncbi:hypothetical protein [Natrarchaeobius oligotrophus]|uniref:DNA polymerase sliding clamp n=1 Tax=Natrarchaeobius chitinivorans TaxID=1679083 RepID=A0A3N6MBB0_NATCH|nr:hypothetical protein [Natrarchaeobius chitinivorans]RQG93710.1 hypothetical protein EA472_22505 [Natrarchaeobius chitinivorans]
MSETEQQTIVEGESYVATMAVDDLEELVDAIRPIESVVYLDFDHDHLEVRARDFVNVYATRVRKPIDAPHATVATVKSTELIEAVDAIRWADDDVRLELDDDLWIFDGDENRRTFQEVEREPTDGVRDRPEFDDLLEWVEWNVRATCDAWQFAGAVRTVAEPASVAVRVSAEDFGVRVEGDGREFDDEAGEMAQIWPYFDRFDADVETACADADDATCVVSEDYARTVADAVPVSGDSRIEIRFGHDQPLYVESESGVEVVIAPRITGDDDE